MSRFKMSLSVLTMILALGACKKADSDAEQANAAPVVIAVPTTEDSAAWRTYLGQVAAKQEYQNAVTDSTIPYFLPVNSKTLDNVDANSPSSPYSRQMEIVQPAIERTVTKGNLLVFASPDSATMADFIVEAFTGATPVALKGSSVLFVGKSADADRVKNAVTAAGGNFMFEEVP